MDDNRSGYTIYQGEKDSDVNNAYLKTSARIIISKLMKSIGHHDATSSDHCVPKGLEDQRDISQHRILPEWETLEKTIPEPKQTHIEKKKYEGAKDHDKEGKFHNVTPKHQKNVVQIAKQMPPPEVAALLATEFALTILGQKHPERRDQGDFLIFDKVGPQDFSQQLRTCLSISSQGDKDFDFIFITQLKESGIFDTMNATLLLKAMEVLGEEFFQEFLAQTIRSTPTLQDLQPDAIAFILFALALLARIAEEIRHWYITSLNSKLKDRTRKVTLRQCSKVAEIPKKVDNAISEYLIDYQDGKKQGYKQDDTAYINFNFYLGNGLKRSTKSQYKIPYKSASDKSSAKLDFQYQSERKSSQKVSKPKLTVEFSGDGPKPKDTHKSAESSLKVKQTLSSQKDDASNGCHSSLTQDQPQVQSKPKSDLLPGKQLDFLKEEGAKPAEASGGQVQHQEQTKAEPKTHENIPQLKLLAALTWERASPGIESSDSSDSSDRYEGMYSESSSSSNRDDSAVSSTATENSKTQTTDVKDSTSSRSSDTLQDLSSRELPALVQGATREHDQEMFHHSEETTGLSQNKNIMMISVLLVANPSLNMSDLSDCASSEDDGTVHTVFHFSTPVTVSSFDSQEQHQSYQEYIPIDSPVHTDMSKRIEDLAKQRKQLRQDEETSTTSLTSNHLSGQILAHPQDETGPLVLEEQLILLAERQGAPGFTARPRHTDSSHCSEGTPIQTSVLHPEQWQESAVTHYHPERTPVQATEPQPNQRPNFPAQLLSHVPEGPPLQASTAQATARSGPSCGSAGIHIQSALRQTGLYPGSFAFSHNEERAPAQTAVVEICQVAGSHGPERTYTQTATIPTNCTGGCSAETGSVPFMQRQESSRTHAQAAFPNGHQSCWSSTGSNSAPIQRLPPIVVHAAGALPPWATTTARIDLGRAANREYAQLRSRRATYDDDWSYNSGIDPANMALSGFFHIGGERHVRCFYCGLELNPASQDNIWDEHVRRSPECAYLLAIMGEDMVRQTQENFRKHEK